LPFGHLFAVFPHLQVSLVPRLHAWKLVRERATPNERKTL
jgi:hypothetical protein